MEINSHPTSTKALHKMEGARQRVAIITGAGAGIGEQTTYAFAKRGFSLVLVDIIGERLVKVAENVENLGVKAEMILTITEDLSNETSFESIINQAVAKFGQIDVLINNAGFAVISAFEDLKIENVDKMYKVLLRAPLFLSQKAFPHLKKTKGCIVNVTSLFSRLAVPLMIDYCSMKAALEHLTRCLALEGAQYGIRVNNIHPGTVVTSLYDDMPNKEEVLTQCKKNTPIGHIGDGTEVASAIMYLASDDASYITGASLFIDGGGFLSTPWSGITTQ